MRGLRPTARDTGLVLESQHESTAPPRLDAALLLTSGPRSGSLVLPDISPLAADAPIPSAPLSVVLLLHGSRICVIELLLKGFKCILTHVAYTVVSYAEMGCATHADALQVR